MESRFIKNTFKRLSAKYLNLPINAVLICLLCMGSSEAYSQPETIDLPYGPEVLEQMITSQQSQLTESFVSNSQETPQSLIRYCENVWFYVKDYALYQEKLYQNQLPSLNHYELAEFQCSASNPYNHIFETLDKKSSNEFSTEHYVSKFPSVHGYEIFYLSSGISREEDCAGGFFEDCQNMTFGGCQFTDN